MLTPQQRNDVLIALEILQSAGLARQGLSDPMEIAAEVIAALSDVNLGPWFDGRPRFTIQEYDGNQRHTRISDTLAFLKRFYLTKVEFDIPDFKNKIIIVIKPHHKAKMILL